MFSHYLFNFILKLNIIQKIHHHIFHTLIMVYSKNRNVKFWQIILTMNKISHNFFFIFVYLYTHTHAHTNIYIHSHTYSHTHIIHTHTHKHTHAHIYVCIPLSTSPRPLIPFTEERWSQYYSPTTYPKKQSQP